jgi:hypothetical protein
LLPVPFVFSLSTPYAFFLDHFSSIREHRYHNLKLKVLSASYRLSLAKTEVSSITMKSKIFSNVQKMFRNFLTAIAVDHKGSRAPSISTQPDFEKSAMTGRRFSVKIWSRKKTQLNGTPAVPTKTQVNGTVCAVPQADVPKERVQGEKVQSKEIRALCELIRKRYALDIDIWDLKDSRDRDRDEVWALIYKSDAALAKVKRTLDSWDRPDLFDSERDWHRMQDIKRRINLEGKRDWVKHPPWEGLN